MNIQDLIQPHLLGFTPYSSARDEFKGKAKQMMDANENSSFGPYNRYPDPQQRVVKEKIAQYLDVKSANIVLSNGSDECIDLIIRLFCKPFEDAIVQFAPTYGMYQVCASVQGVRVITIQQESDFSIPKDISYSHLYTDQKAKILFLCNPNNPTGQLISIDTIRSIARAFKGMVVVDEAYIEFSDQSSAICLLDDFPNVIILRTFSKAWGMAGLRLGMAIANEQVSSWISAIKMPYNINSFTQEYALRALVESPLESYIEMIKKERSYLTKSLRSLTIVEQVYESQANFILVVFKQARLVFERLLKDDIVIRDRSNLPGCSDCLRISIGTPAQNQLLINTLKTYQ